MYSTFLTLALALLFADAVRAGVFVVEPLKGSTCHANKPCTITWLDNGVYPLLSAVGVCTVGLYTGQQQLVQTIPPVDVSKMQSVTFTPNRAAGPNSDTYYIAITSTTLKGNDSTPYVGWSPYFTLAGMSGSFDDPLSSATVPIPIPSTLTRSTSGAIATSTRVILPPSSTTTSTARSKTTSKSSSSQLSTVFTSSSSTSPSSSSTSISSTTPPSLKPTDTLTTTSATPTSTSTSTSTFATIPTAPLSATTSAAAAANAVATSSAAGASRLSPSVLIFTVASSLLYLSLP